MQLLQQKTMRDSLTGLLNYESFKDVVSVYIQHQKPGTLILFDVDDFKRINDTKGHLIGDEVLIRLTKFFKSFFNENDVLSRFGGDEFLAFIPGKMNQEEMSQKMENCLKQIAQLSVFENIHINCSIGISEVDSNLSIDENFMKIDQALYQSKNNGKNTYTFC